MIRFYERLNRLSKLPQDYSTTQWFGIISVVGLVCVEVADQ